MQIGFFFCEPEHDVQHNTSSHFCVARKQITPALQSNRRGPGFWIMNSYFPTNDVNQIRTTIREVPVENESDASDNPPWCGKWI